MHILGHGVDIVSVARIARMHAEHGDRFLRRCFTDAERAYGAESRRRYEHLAARFAAKEAALKALGTGRRGAITWTDVEVVREATGRPALLLTGEAARVARSAGVERTWVALSHTEGFAVATVIVEGVPPVAPS